MQELKDQIVKDINDNLLSRSPMAGLQMIMFDEDKK